VREEGVFYRIGEWSIDSLADMSATHRYAHTAKTLKRSNYDTTWHVEDRRSLYCCCSANYRICTFGSVKEPEKSGTSRPRSLQRFSF